MLGLLRVACRRVRHDLWDYAGERLPEGTLEQVERHLVHCAACRADTGAMRRAQQLLTEAQAQTPAPRSGWSELQQRLEREGLLAEDGTRTFYAAPMPWAGAETERAVPRRSPAFGLSRLYLAGSMAACALMGVFTYHAYVPVSNGVSQSLDATPSPAITPVLSADTDATARYIWNTGDFFRLPVLPESRQAAVGGMAKNRSAEPAVRPFSRPEVRPRLAASAERTRKMLSRTIPSAIAANREREARPERNTMGVGSPPKTVLPAEGRTQGSSLFTARGTEPPNRYVLGAIVPASYKEDDSVY